MYVAPFRPLANGCAIHMNAMYVRACACSVCVDATNLHSHPAIMLAHVRPDCRRGRTSAPSRPIQRRFSPDSVQPDSSSPTAARRPATSSHAGDILLNPPSRSPRIHFIRTRLTHCHQADWYRPAAPVNAGWC